MNDLVCSAQMCLESNTNMFSCVIFDNLHLDNVVQDAIEINFSCPHGMPERKMGAAVGQDCALLEEVCGWINEKATVPVWAKMTPNITDITQVAYSLFALGYCIENFDQVQDKDLEHRHRMVYALC